VDGAGLQARTNPINLVSVPKQKNMRFFYNLAACSALLLSGVAVLSTPSPSAAAIQCPDTWGGTIKCDYYKDGYKAGKRL